MYDATARDKLHSYGPTVLRAMCLIYSRQARLTRQPCPLGGCSHLPENCNADAQAVSHFCSLIAHVPLVPSAKAPARMARWPLEHHQFQLNQLDSISQYLNLDGMAIRNRRKISRISESSMTPVSYVDIHTPRAPGSAAPSWVEVALPASRTEMAKP